MWPRLASSREETRHADDPRADSPGHVLRRVDRGHPGARSAADGRSVLPDGRAPAAVGRRCARRADDGRGALRPGPESHQYAGRADHSRQQRPHHPRPAHLGRPDALLARGVSAPSSPAERVVRAGGPRYLESASGPLSRPVRHHEGHGRAAAQLRAGRVEPGPGPDYPRGQCRGEAARAPDRHDERGRAPLLRTLPRPGRRPRDAPARPRSAPVPGPHRSSRYDRRPEGQEHGSQGIEGPRGRRARRSDRLGARARGLLHRRPRHGGRAALLFPLRRGLCDRHQ